MARYDQIIVMMFAVSACASFLCLVYLGFMTNNTSSSSTSVRSRMLVQLLCFGSSLARASLFSINPGNEIPDILCGAIHFVLIAIVCVWWTRLLKRGKDTSSSGEPQFVRQGRVAFTFFTLIIAALMVMRLPTSPNPCFDYKTEVMFVTVAGCLFNFIFAFSTLLQLLRFRSDQATGPTLYTAGFAAIALLSLVQFVLLVTDDDVCVADYDSIRSSTKKHHSNSLSPNEGSFYDNNINNESSSLRRRLDFDDGSYENVALFVSLLIEVMRFMIVSVLCAPDSEECAEETPVRDWVHIMLLERRHGGHYNNNRGGTGRSPMKPVLDALQGSVRDWVIPWSQIKRAQKIKSGGEAQVFKATYHGAGIALKEMYTSLVSDGEDLSDFCQEVAVLKRLHHPFVVTVYGISMRPSFTPEGVSRWFLVMELMASSLRDFLKQSPGIFEIDLVLRICLQICSGMRYLHREGTVHRDLKPENVLVNVKSAKELSLGLVRIECKICDFGLARQIVGNRRLRISYGGGGTVGYRAPELIGSRIWRYQQSRGSLTAGLSQHSDVSDRSEVSPASSPGRRLESHTSLKRLAESVVGGSPTSAASRKKREHYDRAVDVFSFGVVMYELFTRKRAFRDEAERRWKSRQQKVFPWQVDHIVTTGYRPRITICPPAIAALIRRCWAEDPNVRPAFGDISKQLESVYYRHVESKMSPRMEPHRVSVFKKNQESPRISRVVPPLASMVENFHLDARSKIGGPPTSCSQPEQRSLFLRPKVYNNKIPLHGIFTGEDEGTKISRSCSPSMFKGRVKKSFISATQNSSSSETERTTNDKESLEEESKDELFTVEESYSDLQTPIKTQSSGLLHEILSTPDDSRGEDEDWFNTSKSSLHPTPTSTRTSRLITPPKPFRIPTPMISKCNDEASTTDSSVNLKTPIPTPPVQDKNKRWLHERVATGISTEPTTSESCINRNLFGGLDGSRRSSNSSAAEDVHVSLSEGRPFSPFRKNRPKVGEGRKRSYSCD